MLGSNAAKQVIYEQQKWPDVMVEATFICTRRNKKLTDSIKQHKQRPESLLS